jgi:gamma-glutamyl-gamma-aminobutyrate hydrolase PuuD
MKRVAVTYRFARKLLAYADALRKVGVEPVGVSPEQPLSTTDRVEGLLLTGGTDLDPGLYGQPPDPRSETPDPMRDRMELTLLREALDRDLPVLAICRGMQLLNVAHPGGTLFQHIEGHAVRGDDPSRPVHPVMVEHDTLLSRIIASDRCQVNSRHHQAVDRVGEGLVVVARAHDGIVEGVERTDRRFVLGIQWHPEDQVDVFPEQRRLFEAFRDVLGAIRAG